MRADLQSKREIEADIEKKNRHTQQRKTPDYIHVSGPSLFPDSAAPLP